MKKIFDTPVTTIIRDSLLFLVFFSLITGFIEATYTFGLLGTDIPPEVVYVLFLFSPFLLLLAPRILDSRGFRVITGGLALVSWAISLPLDTRWRMLATGVGCGCFLLYLACHVRQSSRSAAEHGAALGFGVLLSILLRSLHSGNLLLNEGWSLVLGAAIAVLALSLLLGSRARTEQPDTAAAKIGFPRSLGLCLGLFSVLILVYFAFTSPTVIARWGEVSDATVTAVQAVALAVFLGAWLGVPGFHGRLSPVALLAWNVLFILALALTLLLRQPRFSVTAVYPLYAADPDLVVRIAFWTMLVLHPVIYTDFALLAGALHSARPSPRKLAVGFGLSAVFLLLLALGQIFTTVYDYIPVIGPWFRDRFWLVIVFPAVIAALSLLLVKRDAYVKNQKSSFQPGWLVAGAIVAGASILLAGLSAARPMPAPKGDVLRVLTYNIQQGYGKNGEKNFKKQLEVIRQLDPDVIGLQETDTARIAGGNSDIVRYFADGLALYSYYGPTPVSGTFGVALLSRYPIRNPRTFFMPSRGEQTACIEADVAVGDTLVRVLVTHLDNDGALAQQRLVIDRASRGAAGPALVIAVGDFNFKASTEQYRQTTDVLDDSWVTAEVRLVEPGAPDPAGRIDHIFVSRNTRVLRSRYIPKGPSDHPGILAELAW
ncbi:MAG: endonuclease/exonuclease/phosphatase family protein [Spirochaetes bacterium]|nr:endonuclease/exonuclease/phosphatase family protein [Spirochaetota bacterium]